MRTTSVPPPVLPLLLTELGIASPCTAELLLLVPSALAMSWLHPGLSLSSQQHWRLLILVLRCCLAGDVVGTREGGWLGRLAVLQPGLPFLPLEENVVKGGVTECSPFQKGLPAQGQTGMLRRTS